MTAFVEISQRARDKYHNLEDDEMVKSIFNSKKNKDAVGMKIPNWMITDEMKLTEHYQMYVAVFGVDVPTTQSQPTESTQGTHRTTSTPRSPNSDMDKGESSVQKKSTVIRLHLPPRRSTRLTPPTPVPTTDEADDIILQDTIQLTEEIEKLVDATANVKENVEVDSTTLRQNDNQNDPDNRLEPRSNKESLEELTKTDPKPSSSTPSSFLPKSKLSAKNCLLSLFKPETGRFKQYKSFFNELQGRYGYFFEHLKTRFVPIRKFNVLAQHLQDIMEESLPKMVDDRVKELTKKQNSVTAYDPIFKSQEMSTSDAHQQSLANAGSETRPSMLERGSYKPWASSFRRYLNRKRENRKYLNKAIDDGPYEFRVFTPSETEAPRMQKEEDLRGDDLKHYEVEIEEMNLILNSIPNDIYNSVDACTTAKAMNGIIFLKVTINTKFLNCLQPKWLKYVTQVRLVKRLTDDSYDDLFGYLQNFKKLVNISRAKKLEKTHDPLALVAHTGSSSRTTTPYDGTHPSSVVDYDDDYQRDTVQNNSDDPLTFAMILLARDGVNIQSRNFGNDGRNTRRSYVQEEVIEGTNVQNDAGNIQMTLRTTSSTTAANVQCYNCSEKAKQDEAGLILTDEQNDFLFADALRMEEIEELSANICLMARIQLANIDFDIGLSYDFAFLSELQHEKERRKCKYSLKNVCEPSWISKLEKLESENLSLGFKVQSLIKERDNVKTEYQKLFDSIKKTRAQTQGEIYELVENVKQKTYAYADVCAQNQDLLMKISELKDNLKNVDKDRESNLYSISIFDMAASSPVCPMSKATSTKSWLWHRTLSYLNSDTRGKSKKSSHLPKLVPSTHLKLELLHMDLCGPMRVASINEKKYILVIVDDYSRFTQMLKDEIELSPRLHAQCLYFHDDRNFFGPKQFPPLALLKIEDLDNLFGPMYDEYFKKKSSEMPIRFAAQQDHNHEDSTSTSLIVIEEYEAPPIISLSDEQTALISLNEAGEFFQEDSAELDGNTLLTPYDASDLSKNESSTTLDPSNMHDILEPKNIKGSMQDELHQFERLAVWELVPGPDGKNIIALKWLWKNKSDEEKKLFETNLVLLQRGIVDPTLFTRRHGGDILLVQVYVDDIIFSTHMATERLDADLHGTLTDQMTYRRMIGGLMYLAAIRPDITFATFVCARYQARPTVKHLKEVKRILRMQRRLQKYFRRHPIYSDKLVSWSLKKQDCTAMSTAKAEYVSLSACRAQVIWMRTQLVDYGYKYNLLMYCDLKSTIVISCNAVQHSRTKHIDIMHHFSKEHVENGTMKLYFVGTEYQPADLITKTLPKDRFEYLVHRIVIIMAQPQKPADVHQDELCPPSKRYALMDANKKVDLENPLYPDESIIVENILQNHPLKFSIAASSSVPWIYLGQFWHSLQEDGSKYHNLEDDVMIKSIFNLGKSKGVVGMKIPDWMITNKMKVTENYRLYAKVFGVDVPTTHLTEQKIREEDEARENVKKFKEYLMSKEIEKLVDETKNVEKNVEADSSTLRNDDNRNDLDTRTISALRTPKPVVAEGESIAPRRCDKKSWEVEITDVVQPVNINDEWEETTKYDYELRRKEKGKHVEEIRNTPSPTTIRSPRIQSNLINEAIYNHIPSHVDSSFKNYMSGNILHVHQTKDTSAFAQEQQYQLYMTMRDNPKLQKDDVSIWLALKIKFKRLYVATTPCRPSAVRLKDQEDPHDNAHPEEENSAKRQKTSEHGTFVSGESSSAQDNESKPGPSTSSNQSQLDDFDFWTDSYATDDDELPTEKVSQELVEELYQQQDNLTTPTITFPGIEKYKVFSIVSDPVYGIIYKNSKKEKRVMRHQECHKFCDAILKREEIEERLNHHDQLRRWEMTIFMMMLILRGNSAKRQKTSEHETYVIGESSSRQVNKSESGPSTSSNQEHLDDFDFWTDSYATDDDELPMEKVSQELVDEITNS
nr:hypothetical protein [Tanacetum cinerariifolium]